jgi:hypothetical protein
VTTVYVGMDPGLTGAIVTLEDGELQFFDTPTFKAGNRSRIAADGCARLLERIDLERGNNPLVVAIEKAGSFSPAGRKQGSVSMFGYGVGYGIWIGILEALKIPYTEVPPQTWKRLLMAGERKEKDASRAVARRLWPDQTEEALSRRKDHGRADAALIAEYARRVL